MKVSLEILRRVYEIVQDQGNKTNDNQKETIDPESHLFFISAYEMPLWSWSQERGTFEKYDSDISSTRAYERQNLQSSNAIDHFRLC
jgi:DNA polymerase epsilon subunit 2